MSSALAVYSSFSFLLAFTSHHVTSYRSNAISQAIGSLIQL